jgi:hypothetical protein
MVALGATAGAFTVPSIVAAFILGSVVSDIDHNPRFDFESIFLVALGAMVVPHLFWFLGSSLAYEPLALAESRVRSVKRLRGEPKSIFVAPLGETKTVFLGGRRLMRAMGPRP